MNESNDNGMVRKLLMAKTIGFTNAISKLSREERAANPTRPFGEDYNRLITAVSTQFPNLNPYLPPRASFFNNELGPGTCGSYGEILTWCEQVYQLLSAE
jgi:hypothetical protein